MKIPNPLICDKLPNRMKISPKTIIFDFDGVLVDTHKDIALAANYVLTQAGLPELPPETIKGYIGNGPVVLMQRCLAKQSANLLEKLAPLFEQRYKEYPFAESSLYPGVMKVLAHYNKLGKTMAIATQKSGAMTSMILENLGVPMSSSMRLGLCTKPTPFNSSTAFITSVKSIDTSIIFCPLI